MIITIACLVIGILGFVKGRINISKNRELRGAPMYVAASLLCLPLPLSFLAGMVIGANAVATGKPIDQSTIMVAGLITTWVPILASLVIGFALAKPKELPGQPRAQGFEVKM